MATLKGLLEDENFMIGMGLLGEGAKGKSIGEAFNTSAKNYADMKKAFSVSAPKTKAVINTQTGGLVLRSDKQIAETNKGGDILIPAPKKGVTVNTGNSQNEFEKALGKGDADTVLNLRKLSESAVKENDSLTLVTTLAKELETGQFGTTLLDLAKLGKRFGVDMNFLSQYSDSGSIDGTIANAETLKIVSSVFVFDAIGKTKGSISEKEMQLFQDISLGLGTTPEGIALTSTIKRRLNERIIEKSEMMEAWVADGSRPTSKKDTPYGKLTFNQMYNKYINQKDKNGDLVNPLFTKEEYANMTNITSANTKPNIITDKQGNRYYRTQTGGFVALPKLK